MNETIDTFTPFAGRQAILTRLQQYLLESATHAMTFTSLEGMGKTALLHQVPKLDENFVAVYIAIAEPRLTNNNSWLDTLVKRTLIELERYGLNVDRIPLAGFDDDLPTWMNTVFLPEVSRLVRPHRRIVWMLDDAHHLVHAVSKGTLPANSAEYLQKLLLTHKQLNILVTADVDYEDDLKKLAPLVNPLAIERINRLTQDETKDLLNLYLENVPDTLVKGVYDQTGGVPRLLQRYATQLRQYTDFDVATNQVYNLSKDEFKRIWLKLTRDQRLVLTAMSSLCYENPLRPIMPSHIENWLVETDYPLDTPAIHSQLRGLEYRELVSNTPTKIEIVGQLLQRWLFENARLEETPVTDARNRQRFLLVVLLLVIIVSIFALITLYVPSREISTPNIPTVTLGN